MFKTYSVINCVRNLESLYVCTDCLKVPADLLKSHLNATKYKHNFHKSAYICAFIITTYSSRTLHCTGAKFLLSFNFDPIWFKILSHNQFCTNTIHNLAQYSAKQPSSPPLNPAYRPTYCKIHHVHQLLLEINITSLPPRSLQRCHPAGHFSYASDSSSRYLGKAYIVILRFD